LLEEHETLALTYTYIERFLKKIKDSLFINLKMSILEVIKQIKPITFQVIHKTIFYGYQDNKNLRNKRQNFWSRRTSLYDSLYSKNRVIFNDVEHFDPGAEEAFQRTTAGTISIITNKLYEDTREYARDLSPAGFSLVRKDKTSWMITEFGNRLKSWSRFRRSIYTKLQAEQDGQYILESSRPESIITTNIGMCRMADDRMRRTCGEKYFKAEEIVRLSHSRGADELIHRSLKELATREQLPFKAFGMNQAYYYLLVIVHFMFETYKRDVTPDVIPVTVYPDTFRRRLIDFAVKITSKARYIVMSVTRNIYETIHIDQLWKRCQSPPVIQFA